MKSSARASSAKGLAKGSAQAGPGQRITLHIPPPLAARLAALCELHPSKSSEQMLLDLVQLGLTQVEASAPIPSGNDATPFHMGQAPVYLVTGPFPEFHHLVLKHHRRIERELAGDEPESPTEPDASGYSLVDDG